MKRSLVHYMNAPAVLLLSSVTIVPVIALFYFALHRVNGYTFSVRSRTFTFSNFGIWFDSGTVQAAVRTWEYASISVTAEIVFGTAVALIVSSHIRTITSVVRILSIPVMTSPLAVGMIWKLLFSADGGWVNAMLGVEVPWMSLIPMRLAGTSLAGWMNLKWGFFILLVADIWQWTPLVIIVVLTRLITVPRSIIEAASIDGLTNWKTARVVLLPLLRPTLLVLALLRLIDSLRVFENIWTLFGDNDSAVSMTSLIVRETLLIRDYGRGAALAILFIAMVTGSLAVLIATARRNRL